MTFLNPIWLWAIGGLAVPIAIHLLSRKEGKTIRIGSIRFLTETTTSKFSSIRLNEIVLLAIRSLLIILLVMFLANLIYSTNPNASQKWVVIEKGLENNRQIKKLLDSLQKDDYEIHSLSTGFSLLEDDTITQSPDYYKLSEQLSQRNTVQAIVIAQNTLANFKGNRISLPENITWLSYPASSAEHSRVDSSAYPDTVKITLVHDQEFQYDAKIVRAALHALHETASKKILITETDSNMPESPDSDWLIWLSADTSEYTGKSLRFKEDATSDLIVQEGKNQWLLTKRLYEGNAVEQHLSVQLMSMLFNEEIGKAIRKRDTRILPDKLTWSPDGNAQSIDALKAGQPADKILILMIVLILIAERILAFYRKQ